MLVLEHGRQTAEEGKRLSRRRNVVVAGAVHRGHHRQCRCVRVCVCASVTSRRHHTPSDVKESRCLDHLKQCVGVALSNTRWRRYTIDFSLTSVMTSLLRCCSAVFATFFTSLDVNSCSTSARAFRADPQSTTAIHIFCSRITSFHTVNVITLL